MGIVVERSMVNRILIVDDNAELLELLMEALEFCDFKVRILSDGTELFNILESFKPDLLILDNILPGENGEYLCKKVRETYSLTLPIILISAYPTEYFDNGCFNEILFKPFGLDTLLEKINYVSKLSA